MKNNKNRKRVLPLLLAMLLLIGAGAYGTRAFFTDEEALKTSIKIQSGTLDIVVANASWLYAPLKNADTTEVGDINDTYFVNDKLTYTNSIDTVSKTVSADGTNLGMDLVVVTNARPGDAFEREITITNNGTLDVIIPNTFVANLNLQSDNQRNFKGKPLFLTTFTSSGAGTTEVYLIPNQTVTYTMKIEVNHAVNFTDGLNADLDTVTEFALKNIIITAKQPNDGASYPNK